MKWTTAVAVFSFFAIACAPPAEKEPLGTEADVRCLETVSTDVFAEGIQSASAIQLIDVRSPEEVAEGYIEGAVNINFYDNDFKEQITRLDRETPIYIYCAKGGRSRKAGELLEEEGYCGIFDLDGGVGDWQDAGKGLVK